MDKRARYYKNKRYFESDDFKKSTGVKQGLRLCGNEDEIKVANQLSKFFKITFSKEGTFKTTSYVFIFCNQEKSLESIIIYIMKCCFCFLRIQNLKAEHWIL